MTQQLNAQDAQFLYLRSDIQGHVMAISLYDPATAPGGKVRFRDIVGHVGDRVPTSPVYKRKVRRLPFDFDHPYWVEDQRFDLESHIAHVRLPEPGDWRQFCILTARHFSRPMDLTRPFWDMLVVEGLDRIDGVAPGTYALLTRIHHAAIDGTSATHFLGALSDKDPDGTPAVVPDGPPAEIGAEPGAMEILTRAFATNMTSPVKMLGTLSKFAPALASKLQTGSPINDKYPQTRFNAPISSHKMFDAVTFQFSDLSAIRKLVEGATINDVVLAICGGALRAYLAKHGELPGEPLLAWVPVNARTASGQEQIPGNDLSSMSVQIGTHIADPVERLQAINAFTRDAKEVKAGVGARLLTDLTKHAPGAALAGVCRLMTGEKFSLFQANLMVTNVPGPQYPLYMNGARQTHYFATAPISHNMGLFIAVLSYNGTISFSVTSDRNIMPDIDFFCTCLRAALDDFKTGKPAGKSRRSTRA